VVNVNLIPWRDQHRRAVNRRYLILLAVIGVSGLIAMLMVYGHYHQRYQKALVRCEALTQQLANMANEELELTTLSSSSRQLIVQGARQSQQQLCDLLQLLDSFSEHPMSGVYFSRVLLANNVVDIKGQSTSAFLMTRLEKHCRQFGWSVSLKKVFLNQQGLNFVLKLKR